MPENRIGAKKGVSRSGRTHEWRMEKVVVSLAGGDEPGCFGCGGDKQFSPIPPTFLRLAGPSRCSVCGNG